MAAMPTTDSKPATPLKMIRDFFGMNLAQMKVEWSPMPQEDKDQLLLGLRNGTLTY